MAYLNGELERSQKALKNATEKHDAERAHLEQTIAAVEQDLQALKRTLALHEIPIDASQIWKTCQHKNSRSTGYGEMTRLIFEFLAELKGQSAPTHEIAVFVALATNVQIESRDFSALRLNVRHRLKELANQQRIKRIHNVHACSEGRWAALEFRPGND